MKALGGLLLHGFTSHINCIDPAEPRLKKLGWPYRTPILRGHGTKPDDLEGVVWQDWLADGEKALHQLLQECEKVVPVAISMGSLVALNLAVKYPDKIAGLVCIAPALKTTSKTASLAPLVARFQKTWQPGFDPKSYFDLEQAKTSQNYAQAPWNTVVQFLNFAKHTYNPTLVSQLKMPIQIIASTNDRTIDHRTAQWLYDKVSSPDKNLSWFHRSGHEMLRDAEREQVLDVVQAFLTRLEAEAVQNLSPK